MLPLFPPLALALLPLLGRPARADLDVAFVLDTTGSMSGELHEARTRALEIVAALQAARPQERIRLGVVAYRDRGDAWLTRSSPLSEDATVTSHFLAGLDANGGGDAPEDVISGLRAALEELEWAPQADKEIFLIADAPAHTDYADGGSLAEVAALAVERGVVVHAIGCRSLGPEGVTQLRGLAYATEGQYHHIGRVEADGGGLAQAMLATLAPTPGDDGALQPMTVHESRRGPAPVPAQGPAQGPLVRLGTWFAPLEREPEGGGLACSLTVMLPDGMGLSAPPEVARGEHRLHVTLPLAPGQGLRGVWELESCVPAVTPVQVALR